MFVFVATFAYIMDDNSKYKLHYKTHSYSNAWLYRITYELKLLTRLRLWCMCHVWYDNILPLLQYIYVINGVELTKLARDFIKYLLGGAQSIRLKRA